MEILYTSGAIKEKIQFIFSPKIQCRRVVIVAYVGQNCLEYLGDTIDGIEVYCCPQGGSTSPDGIRQLLKAGAEVSFADNLHMKVYWSETQGCVICSANLSNNGLGGNLKEAGVFIEPDNQNSVDIEKLINGIKPCRPVTQEEMDRLDRQWNNNRVVRRQMAEDDETEDQDNQKDLIREIPSFSEWYDDWHDSSFLKEDDWRFTWYIGKTPYRNKETRNELAKRKITEPIDSICVSKILPEKKWLLICNFNKCRLDWLFVDFVTKKSPEEEDYKECPYEAVQVYRNDQYPFKLDENFTTVFCDFLEERIFRRQKLKNKMKQERCNIFTLKDTNLLILLEKIKHYI